MQGALIDEDLQLSSVGLFILILSMFKNLFTFMHLWAIFQKPCLASWIVSLSPLNFGSTWWSLAARHIARIQLFHKTPWCMLL